LYYILVVTRTELDHAGRRKKLGGRHAARAACVRITFDISNEGFGQAVDVRDAHVDAMTNTNDGVKKKMGTLTFTVLGEPSSKSNSRRVVPRRGGGVAVIKSQAALSYAQSFRLQAPKLPDLLDGPLSVDITIWYGSMRKDLDPSLILDCMQGLIYKNDRCVWEISCRRRLDKENPRSTITVVEFDA